MCIYIYTYTHTHLCIYTHIHLYLYLYLSIYIYIYIYTKQPYPMNYPFLVASPVLLDLFLTSPIRPLAPGPSPNQTEPPVQHGIPWTLFMEVSWAIESDNLILLGFHSGFHGITHLMEISQRPLRSLCEFVLEIIALFVEGISDSILVTS